MDAALDEARPDLVALQGLWQYSSLATRRQWRRKGTPYVISPRGMLDKWALANSRWKKVMAAYAFENAVLRDASCLHALCVAEADAIRAHGLQHRIEVVPNGVELPAVLAGDSRSKTEDSRVGRRRLVFLGRIHPKKGLVGALRAWAKLRNSPSAIRDSAEWQFVIAGWDQGGHEGELRALCADLGLNTAVGTTKDTNIHENIEPRMTRICTDGQQGDAQGTCAGDSEPDLLTSKLADAPVSESLIRSASGPASALDARPSSLVSSAAADVLFYGPAFGEEKEALLRSAEAFILPSFSEGLPMSVLEAWSYGLPVVMTPECNLPEGFACGAALEIRSGEGSFQDGMRILIEMTNQERAAMGMRGRRLVEERFTWPKVAAKMKKIYESLL
jgi:glycosyltransferase involved in cell wall biosynthesis